MFSEGDVIKSPQEAEPGGAWYQTEVHLNTTELPDWRLRIKQTGHVTTEDRKSFVLTRTVQCVCACRY